MTQPVKPRDVFTTVIEQDYTDLIVDIINKTLKYNLKDTKDKTGKNCIVVYKTDLYKTVNIMSERYTSVVFEVNKAIAFFEKDWRIEHHSDAFIFSKF